MSSGPVIVCLDGSRYGETGLGYALPIARVRGAPLLLVEVLELSPRAHPGPVDTVGVEMARAEASHYLKGIAARLWDRGIDVRTETAEGRPADQILRIADREEADLIVLGSHGTREATHFRLGSTAHQVVSHARQSLLVARGPTGVQPSGLADETAGRRLERALVLLDGSAAAEAALADAQSLAKEIGTELVLGHIIARAHWPSSEPPSRADCALLEQVTRRQGELADSYLRGVSRMLEAQGVRCRVVARAAESVRQGVLSLITDEQIDLVMLTSHGQTSSDRVVHGSVVGQLLLYAEAPVWVVQCVHRPSRRQGAIPTLGDRRPLSLREL